MQRQKENANKEDEGRLKDLWKTYGLHTEAGRMLFKSYSRGKKTNISYPKPSTKKWRKPNDRKVLVQNAQREKGCPQKAKINYPSMGPKNQFKYHKIDFVPRRKNKRQI